MGSKAKGTGVSMKFLFAGDLTLHGSGYATILRNLALELTEMEHEVMVLSMGYRRQPHDLPFKLVPIEPAWIYEALRVLPKEWGADRVIVAQDVNVLHTLAGIFLKENKREALWGMEALFPVESEPLLPKWTTALSQFRRRYAISQFGARLCIDNGLPTYFLPIGCQAGKAPEDKTGPKEVLGLPQDKVIYLTVADNQERKGLPLAMEAFSRLPSDTYYVLLTTINANYGYDLNALRNEYGTEVASRIDLRNGGISQVDLSLLYWAADVLVVSSQAEGACLPLYESLAHGTPVICGDWTGMEDVSSLDSVLAVEYEYKYRFPFGNHWRWFASVDSLAEQMMKIYVMRAQTDQRGYRALQEAALQFASTRTWKQSAEFLINTGREDEPQPEALAEAQS